GSAVRLRILGQEGALRGDARLLVELTVDGLEPERAHPHVVGARIAEGHARRRLPRERPALVGEARAERIEEAPPALHRPVEVTREAGGSHPGVRMVQMRTPMLRPSASARRRRSRLLRRLAWLPCLLLCACAEWRAPPLTAPYQASEPLLQE